MKVGTAFGLAPLLFCLTAASPRLADAEAYVVDIYRQIPGGFDYYTSRLGALLRRDARFSRRSGDVGVVEAVPFCACQDTVAGYRILRSSVAPGGSNRAVVSILLRNGSDDRFTVDLVRESGLWRIADVHGPHTPSLLALLEREVPREEKSLMSQDRRK